MHLFIVQSSFKCSHSRRVFIKTGQNIRKETPPVTCRSSTGVPRMVFWIQGSSENLFRSSHPRVMFARLAVGVGPASCGKPSTQERELVLAEASTGNFMQGRGCLKFAHNPTRTTPEVYCTMTYRTWKKKSSGHSTAAASPSSQGQGRHGRRHIASCRAKNLGIHSRSTATQHESPKLAGTYPPLPRPGPSPDLLTNLVSRSASPSPPAPTCLARQTRQHQCGGRPW